MLCIPFLGVVSLLRRWMWLESCLRWGKETKKSSVCWFIEACDSWGGINVASDGQPTCGL